MKITEIRVSGYKNLSGCRIPVGSFNAVVGPNNSGKSNLLEIFRVLHGLCFGPDDERRAFFGGIPFTHFKGRESAVLLHRADEPLKIGLSFQTQVKHETWVVDYDLEVQRSSDKLRTGGFVSEVLKAKQPSKTGPARKYINRSQRDLSVMDKAHPVPVHTSSLSAIAVLYPEFHGLPDELAAFAKDIARIAGTKVYALSPEALRAGIYGESVSPGMRVSAFSLLETLDEVFKQKNKTDQFKEAFLHILDLQDIFFKAEDVQLPPAAQKERRKQRFRLCALQSRNNEWSALAEYSDGTLLVLALVSTLVLDDPNSTLTCIEELENCLHPSAQERLLRFLNENSTRWQLLITTHSPYLVNGISPGDVLVAVVGEDGKTHFDKTSDMKRINELLKSGLLSFGDLMATNFREAIEA